MVIRVCKTHIFKVKEFHFRLPVIFGKQMKTKNSFDYSLDYSKINFRETPELYRVGRGEQGVLLVEPYKSEICPHWKFRIPEIAEKSAKKIHSMFLSYLEENDFIGADMARKFLMMGWTRSLRYANHHSGRKYDEHGKVIPQEKDWKDSKYYKSSRIFKKYFDLARTNEKYLSMKKEWMK